MAAFLAIYMTMIGMFAVLLMAMGPDLVTALSAAATWALPAVIGAIKMKGSSGG